MIILLLIDFASSVSCLGTLRLDMANMWIQTIVTVARFGYHIVRATNSLKLFTGPLSQTLLVPHDFHWYLDISETVKTA